ncbi:MAG: hypothetical protein ABJK25_00285 [Halieaceae bacterium]
MTLQDWGAIGELIGGFAVVASLVYVGLQMKAGNLASRVESKLRLTDKMADFNDLLISNPNLNQIMISGRRSIESLSKDEYLQFSNLAIKASWFLSAAYFMYRNKAISDDDWHELKSIADYWVSSGGYRKWWVRQGGANFTGEFKQFMEREMTSAAKEIPAQ